MTAIKIILKDKREMNIELDEKNAPISCANFLRLVDDGFYEGLCFHRVIANFMIQGGGFEWGAGLVDKASPYGAIKGEFAINGVNNPIKHEVGVISMARTNVKDSATSQFFICVADVPYLDGQYAAFGKTMDEESKQVAIDISTVPTGRWGWYDDVPRDPIVIDKIVRI